MIHFELIARSNLISERVKAFPPVAVGHPAAAGQGSKPRQKCPSRNGHACPMALLHFTAGDGLTAYADSVVRIEQ